MILNLKMAKPMWNSLCLINSKNSEKESMKASIILFSYTLSAYLCLPFSSHTRKPSLPSNPFQFHDSFFLLFCSCFSCRFSNFYFCQRFLERILCCSYYIGSLNSNRFNSVLKLVKDGRRKGSESKNIIDWIKKLLYGQLLNECINDCTYLRWIFINIFSRKYSWFLLGSLKFICKNKFNMEGHVKSWTEQHRRGISCIWT